MGAGVDVGFVHLRTHSYFSLLAGLAAPEALVARAAQLGQRALALTDDNNMFGAVRFYRAAKQAGIKPIFGVHLTIKFTDDPWGPQGRKLTLLATTKAGYKNLLRLATAVRTEVGRGTRAGRWAKAGRWTGDRARTEAGGGRATVLGSAYDAGGIVSDDVFTHFGEGLVALIDYRNAVMDNLAAHRSSEGTAGLDIRILEKLVRALGSDNVYVELQNQALPGQGDMNGAAVAVARRAGAGIVATNDVRYVSESDAGAHAALLALDARTTLDDPGRPTMGSAGFYLVSEAEMRRRLEDLDKEIVDEAVGNTLRIAERCVVRLDTGGLRLPVYVPLSSSDMGANSRPGDGSDLDRGASAATLLTERAWSGAQHRYGGDKRVRDRLQHELDIICDRGLASYFLIVADIVDEAKRRGIPVGPGRGSAASSLVAYCLGITAVDPLAHGLVFERFLNPERPGMPDIDVDVGDEGRDELLAYVRQRFGEEHVAQLVTFGTLAARAAVREAGRVIAAPSPGTDAAAAADRIARLIPSQPGMTLAKAAEQTPELNRMLASDRTAARVFALARALEGVPRHVSVHAAGVVIGDGPLETDVPLLQTEDGTRLTQYAMDEIEALGFLKMDVLGLRTLTVIDRAWRWIGAHPEGGVARTGAALALDDEAVYEGLRRRGTDGVFQLETPMFRNLVRRLQPTTFDDIVALLALGRPGPMQRVDEFIRRRHGQAPATYIHKTLEPILRDTFGIIVYQEQVMHIAMQVAGYAPAEADLFRRRLTTVGGGGDALPEAERERFVRGAQSNGLSCDEAKRVLAELMQFAGYGFAKSHSVAYALLTYETAWLRTHYPAQFLAALLTSHMHSPDRVRRYAQAAGAWGTQLLAPDVNGSGVEFEPLHSGEGAGESAVVFGLAGLRNVGRGAAEAIVEARKGGVFTSFADFRRRLPPVHRSGRLLAALIEAGACDGLGESREHMLEAIGRSGRGGMPAAGHRGSPRVPDGAQRSLFEDVANADRSGMLKETPQNIILQLAHGYESHWPVLSRLLAAHRGDIPVILEVPAVERGRVRVAVGRELWVDGSPALWQQLQRWTAEGRLTAVRRGP